MKILAIETSCDDTCIAVVKFPANKNSPGRIRISRGRRPSERFSHANILSNIVSSQIEVHKKYGGVYPTLAKREHQKNLVPVLEKSLRKAKMIEKNPKPETRDPKQIQNYKLRMLKRILQREEDLFRDLEKFLRKHQKPNIDLIAVTIGPGLEPCLWVGVNFAKALSYFWKIPIISVNHIKAHIFVNVIEYGQLTQEDFPAVCLVASGGHTLLFLMKDFGKYKILGETRDDAAGECFDKTAKILGLSYPGGPIISELASKALQSPSLQCLPRPMIQSKNYDFSFSGLKTAVLYQYQKSKRNKFLASESKNQKYKQVMAAEIQQAIIDVLIKKTLKAAKDFKARTIILGGGVSANKELRKQFKSNVKTQMPNVKFFVPPKNLCTDNAVMTALTGYFRWKKNKKGESWESLKADANLKIC